MSDQSWSVVRLDDAPLSTAAKAESTGMKKAMPCSVSRPGSGSS
jgi:hypothetical protein